MRMTQVRVITDDGVAEYQAAAHDEQRPDGRWIVTELLEKCVVHPGEIVIFDVTVAST